MANGGNQAEFKFEQAKVQGQEQAKKVQGQGKTPVKNELRVFTVSEINSVIKAVLLNQLPPRMAVAGEISDFKCYGSGHCYFTLKDANSQLACVMWASNFKKLKFKLVNGMAVVIKGNIDVYEQSGRYQFYAETMEPEGMGALRLAFEQMVKRLREAGLFDEEHKKPLPAYPFRIGIVTSEAGAAVHDISVSIFNRWPPARLFLYPVPVQGEGAAAQIAAAIRDINRRNKELRLELLIVGRGGGSPEDLWAFNEEVLARAIYNSKIPIISAVGHEIDTSVSDLVADATAATPTKAAVIAVPDIKEVRERIGSVEKRLAADVNARVRFYRESLNTVCAAAMFRNPQGLVHNAAQRLDELSDSLQGCVREQVAAASRKVQAAFERVVQIEPHRLLGRKTVELNDLRNRARGAALAIISRNSSTLQNTQTRLERAARQAVSKSQLALTAGENRLGGLDPRAVLARGYSITVNKRTGHVVRGAEDVEIDDVMVTELAGKNFVESSVTAKQNRQE